MVEPSEHLVLPDGRQLAFRRFGVRGGRPLVVHHGLPGCGLQAAMIHAQAAAAGIDIVAPDRPAFGHSTPQPARTIRGFARDTAALADHVGFARFGVLGISCGGPYALACAHEMPERIDYVGTLAGIGPFDRPDLRRDQHPFLKVLFGLARRHPRLAAPLVLPDAFLFRRNPEHAIEVLSSMLVAPDRALIEADEGLRVAFAVSLAEAYAQGIGGALTEAHLIASPWGFAPEAVRVPVHVYQGGIDRNVPPAMGRDLASRLPRGRWHGYPEEGHLTIVLAAFGDCVRDLLHERERAAASPTYGAPFLRVMTERLGHSASA